MNQNLNHYKTFYMIGKHKSISKAADALFISQPALSRSLSKLEEDLNCKLCIRNSRGILLTPEGELLYEKLKDAFQTIESGEEQLRRITELGIGQLRIGVSTTLCKYILLPYLEQYILENPMIKITIDCQSTIHTLDLLEKGEIDVGLIGAPTKSHNIEFIKVREIQDTFVTTKNYLDNLEHLSNANGTNLLGTAEILEHCNLMLLDEENITRQYIDDYFLKNGITPNQILEVSTMDLLIEFAKIGLGVACVIREFVEEEIENGTLIELKPIAPIESRSIGFAYSSAYHLANHGLREFLTQIRS